MAKPPIKGKITRTAGDALILSGTFDGENLPDAADWVGAVATLNIRPANSATPFLSGGAVDMDVVTREYEYRGAMPPAGTYYFEFSVEFADDTISPLTWPSDGKWELVVIDQIA